MTTPSPDPESASSARGRFAAFAVTIASAVIVITCGTAHEQTPPPVVPAAPSVPSSASVQPVPSEPSASATIAAPPLEVPTAVASAEPDAPAPGPLPRTPGHELDNFYAELRSLQKHARSEPVRVAWLGDSHGASDFWSGALRTALQKQFGNGGPGFVNVGHKGYRHDGVKMQLGGIWRPRPKGASTTIPSGDGMFGLGGFLMIGQEGPSRATFTLLTQDPPLPAGLTWDLCYKPATTKDAIEVKVDGAVVATLASAGEARGALHHHVFTTSSANPTVVIAPTAGFPQLCGVVIEADSKSAPGIVLDELGINGARLATPLAWSAPSWVAELARRSPALMVLEYGTNESGDFKIDPAAYVANLTQVMARVHQASAKTDCLVLAPTDRADTRERTPQVRDALKAAAAVVGCGFWDTYEIMGGKGSILAWRAESSPRAAGDGVHLSARGYRYLGDRLAADVMSAYTP